MRDTSVKFLPASIYNKTIQRIQAFTIETDLDITVTSTSFNISNLSIPLATNTISTLIQSLLSAPLVLTIDNINYNYTALNARCLLQTTTSGARSFYFTDNLLHIILSCSDEFNADASIQLTNMIRQLILTNAESNWADYWGSYFGVRRYLNESDTVYTQRIIAEIFRPRVNKYALENIVELVTSSKCDVFEPWTQLFVLDSSTRGMLSDISHPSAVFPDGQYWSPCTIDVVSDEYSERMRASVERSRASGVWAYYRQNLVSFYDSHESASSHYIQWDEFYPTELTNIWYLDDSTSRPLSGYKVIDIDHSKEWVYYLTSVDILLDAVYDANGKFYNPSIQGFSFLFDVYALINPIDDLQPEDTPFAFKACGEWELAKLIELKYNVGTPFIYGQLVTSIPDKIHDYIFESITTSGQAESDSDQLNVF